MIAVLLPILVSAYTLGALIMFNSFGASEQQPPLVYICCVLWPLFLIVIGIFFLIDLYHIKVGDKKK